MKEEPASPLNNSKTESCNAGNGRGLYILTEIKEQIVPRPAISVHDWPGLTNENNIVDKQEQ